jgi:hypothetical protein
MWNSYRSGLNKGENIAGGTQVCDDGHTGRRTSSRLLAANVVSAIALASVIALRC